MRTCPLPGQALPLPDAETVLLIRYDKRQPVIDSLLLDQRVGADNHILLMGGDPRAGLFFLRCGHGPGQHFGGRHNTALIPAAGSQQQRIDCQDRFPGADIPLDQTAHHIRSCHIAPDLLRHLLLAFCRLKRQPPPELAAELWLL